MAVSNVSGELKYQGLSTDTKPRFIPGHGESKIPLGSTFVETDTGTEYELGENGWFTTSPLPYDVQNPLPADGDSVYCKDIWVDESDVTGWVDVDNADSSLACIPFNNLHTRLENSTTDNPKELFIHFNRTIPAHNLAIGCFGGGNFSNIKLELIGSGGEVRSTIDNSTDDTKRTSYDIGFSPEVFNAVRLSFFTDDDVCLSNINIQKSINVAAQLKALADDGNLIDIGASDSGNLKTTNAESGLAIARGEVVGTSFIHKFGNAPDFDAIDGVVTVWDGANDGDINVMDYIYSTTAAIDSISSTNNTDTQLAEIQGLDENYNLVIQNVTLTGQTRAPLTTPLIRVFRIKNIGFSNFLGFIYVYENTAISGGRPINTSKIRASVDDGNNQTLMSIFTIPTGKTGYMRDWFASTAGANKTSNYVIDLVARPFGQVFQLKHRSSVSDDGNSYIQHVYTEPEVFTEKTDIEIRVRMTATGTTGGSFSAGFDIVLVDNV